jgi:predicted dehydrogenase
VRRVREGLIDKMSMICSHYTGEAFDDPPRTATIESRLQNLVWCNDQALGGGHLVNAAVHAIDGALWVAGDTPPLYAMGASRINRLGAHGDSPDTYSVIYEFADGTILNHRSEHLTNQVGDGNFCGLTAYGKTGTMFGAYEGKTWIHGNKGGYRGGLVQDLSLVGLQRNIATFHECVTQGRCDNPTVPTAVTSTLATILAREACAAGGKVTWEEMLKANRKLEVDLTGLKS